MLRRQRTVLIVSSALVCFVIAFAFVYVIPFIRDPWGIILRERVPAWEVTRPPTSPYSEESHASTLFLTNDIARQSEWTPEQTDRLLDILVQDPPVPPGVPFDNRIGTKPHEQWEAYFEYTLATTVVAERIGLGAPIPDEVVAALELLIFTGIEHPDVNIRRTALSSAQSARWLQRPDIRPLAERIRDHDPDERLANVARRFLLHADGMIDDDNREPCPTCPGHESGP